MTQSKNQQDSKNEEGTDIDNRLQEIIDDRTKALRAPKDIGDKAHTDAEHVENPRSAARYVGKIDGEPMYEVVSTRLRKFPLGSDMHNLYREDQIADWVEQNDVSVVDAESESWDGIGAEATA